MCTLHFFNVPLARGAGLADASPGASTAARGASLAAPRAGGGASGSVSSAGSGGTCIDGRGFHRFRQTEIHIFSTPIYVICLKYFSELGKNILGRFVCCVYVKWLYIDLALRADAGHNVNVHFASTSSKAPATPSASTRSQIVHLLRHDGYAARRTSECRNALRTA